MSATTIVRPFAGRRHIFRLTLGGVEELERLCNAGIGQIYGRLATAAFWNADIRETIRLGLTGGGLSDAEASRLVMDTVDTAPLAHHLGLATAIVTAYAVGVDEALGKSDSAAAEGPGEAGTPRPETSPPSSPPAS
jgi:hypothetical protein